MLEKFLISIGLKQPSSLEPYVDDSTTTVRPSTENRFTNEEEYAGDIRVHQPKDEVSDGVGEPEGRAGGVQMAARQRSGG